MNDNFLKDRSKSAVHIMIGLFFAGLIFYTALTVTQGMGKGAVFTSVALLSFILFASKIINGASFIGVAIALFGSNFLRYNGDRTEGLFVTKILHYKDTDLFTRDLTTLTTENFGPYNYFSHIYSSIPTEYLYPAFYISWLLTLVLVALWYIKFSRLIIGEKLGLTAGCLGFLTLIASSSKVPFLEYEWEFILSGNDWIFHIFRNQTIAIAIGLWALYRHFNRNYYWAAILLSICFYLHIPTGIHFVALAVIDTLFLTIFIRQIDFLKAYLLVFPLLIAPEVFNYLVNSQTISLLQSQNISNPFLLISGYFRAPHHFIMTHWQKIYYFRFSLLIGLVVISFLYIRYKFVSNQYLHRLALLLLLCLAVLPFHLLFTEKWPMDIVAKLGLPRMTIYFKIIGTLVAGICLAAFLERWIITKKMNIYKRDLFFASLLGLLISFSHLVYKNYHQIEGPEPKPVHRFLRENTAKDALVLTSPGSGYGYFAQLAERSIFLDFVRWAQVDSFSFEFWNRINSLFGTDNKLNKAAALQMTSQMNDLYKNLSAEHLLQFAKANRINYVVTEVRKESLPEFSLVFHDKIYFIYKVGFSD